jgi:hypothetical protein
MPLINLKTDLKSLRYGKDTLGGGYSGQPYIQEKIPDGFNNLGANEDFILRGGINAIGDAATDIKRLTKMFVDTKSPSGLLFIAKQNLLSRTAVRTQTSGVVNEGIYTPLNTLAQAGVVELGGHLNKQGINPFIETGAYANSEILYSVKVKPTQATNLNRLVTIYNDVNKGLTTNNFGFTKGTTINPDARIGGKTVPVILKYTGGPGSILGVGNTFIRFSDQRTGENNAVRVSDPNYFYGKGYLTSVTPGINGSSVNKNKSTFDINISSSNTIKGKYKDLGNKLIPGLDKYDFDNQYQTQAQTGELNPLFVANNDYFYGITYLTSIAPNFDVNASGSNTIKERFKQYTALSDTEGEILNNEYQSQNETGIKNSLVVTNTNYFYGKGYPTSVSPGINGSTLSKNKSTFDINISGSNTIKGKYESEGNKLIPGLDNYNFNNEYQTQAQTGELNPLFTTNKNYFFGSEKAVTFTPGNYLKNLYNGAAWDNKGVSGKYFRLVGSFLENGYNEEGKSYGTYNFNVYEPTTEGNTWPKNSPLIYNDNTFTYNQEDIINTSASIAKSSPSTQDFRAILRDKLGSVISQDGRYSSETGATSFSLPYSGPNAGNIEKRVNLGNPGQRAQNSYANYSDGVIDISSGKSPYPNYNLPGIGSSIEKAGLDRITSIPLYHSENVSTDLTVNDLVKFRIAIIDNNSPNFKTFIHFRAFIDSMSDSYTATWNNFQYLGRGENFYTYNGFTRTISLAWTVAAQSKPELIAMYKKLNYLASSLTPDYSANGYMRGVLCQLTVGGYLYEQPGFISSLTYDIETDAPWEVAIGTSFATEGEEATTLQGDPSVKEMPHIIKVQGFSFTPIQKFLPRLQQNSYNGFINGYGDERYISLANGTNKINNNYDT